MEDLGKIREWFCEPPAIFGSDFSFRQWYCFPQADPMRNPNLFDIPACTHDPKLLSIVASVLIETYPVCIDYHVVANGAVGPSCHPKTILNTEIQYYLFSLLFPQAIQINLSPPQHLALHHLSGPNAIPRSSVR